MERGVLSMTGCLKKITPYNGFDKYNPDNARQNSYAWSIAEMGGYIYVGTDRNQVYAAIKGGIAGENFVPPEAITPEKVDMNGEIWRYKKDGKKCWERVYKAPPELEITGIRYLILYTTPSGGTALYAGCNSNLDKMFILKSTDGCDWMVLDTGITSGNSTRTMVTHGGVLYMGVVNDRYPSDNTYLYASCDPQDEGWQQIIMGCGPSRNPRGMLYVMRSYNDHLYIGTARPEGLEVWRTKGFYPTPDGWKLILNRGGGDALNEIPMSMGIFKGALYVGSGIGGVMVSVEPQRRYVPMKGFDLFRVKPDDKWELIAGGYPVVPTSPWTGKRGKPLSGYSSGFGNMFNVYCWQLQEYKGALYLGTLDWSVMLPLFLYSMLNNQRESLKYDPALYVKTLFNQPMFKNIQRGYGFGLWKSCDGAKWIPAALNNFRNPNNYGCRNLFVSRDKKMYIGTANPVQGCEVWVACSPEVKAMNTNKTGPG